MNVDALFDAAISAAQACFLLGTDTAPHPTSAKEASCCSAGIFAGPTALQTYAQVFDEEGALDKLEAFASLNGPQFYGLPANTGRIELKRRPASMPRAVPVGEDEVVVFRGEHELQWSIVEVQP
jgi:dihydroorotase